MKLLLIQRDDVRDWKTWSGTPNAMRSALEKQGVRVDVCDKLGWPTSPIIAIENLMLRLIQANTYYRPRSSRYYARRIRQNLRELEHDWDCAIVIDSFEVLPFLHLGIPIIYVSDCTKTQLIEFAYSGYEKFSPQAERQIVDLEKQAYARASLLAFSSKWAASSAIEKYGVPQEKTRHVLFGASIDQVPTFEEACTRGPWQDSDRCELLFLGVDWNRKGGDIALNVVRELNRMGLRSRLTICGVRPDIDQNEQVQFVPFLDKHKPEELRKLKDLLCKSSFLLLPTQAECFGVVFCEAFAHGLPPVSCQVGGVPEIITHGENGFVLDRDAKPAEYANLIYESFTDEKSYLSLRRSARESYDSTYNWNAWANEIILIAQELVDHTKHE